MGLKWPYISLLDNPGPFYSLYITPDHRVRQMERPETKKSTRIGCCEHLYGQQRNRRESIEEPISSLSGIILVDRGSLSLP